jgi:O-antigen/teichoic acid export membrane protein
MGTNVFALLAAVVTAPLMAQALGPAGRGDVVVVAVPVALATTLLVAGMAGFVGRNVARGRPPGLLVGSVSPILLVSSLIAVLGAFPVAGLLAPEGGAPYTALVIGLLLTPLGLLSRVLLSVATFQERWHITVRMRVLPPAVMAIGVVGLYASGQLTVATAVTLVLVSGTLPVFFLLPMLWHIGRPRLDWAVTREGLSFGSRVWMTVVASQANVRLDQLLMIGLVARAELGMYAVAVNFTGLLGIFAGALVSPVAVRVAQGDKAAAPRALRMALAVLIVGAVALAALAPVVIPLAFGSSFAGATLMALLLLVAAIPQAGGSLLAAAIGSTHRPGASAIAQWLALIVTVPGLLIAVPALGGEGAALVSICAYSITFASLLFSARRHIGGNFRDYLLVRRADLKWMWRTVTAPVSRRMPRSLERKTHALRDVE